MLDSNLILHTAMPMEFFILFPRLILHTILEQSYALFNVRDVEVCLTMKLTVYGV